MADTDTMTKEKVDLQKILASMRLSLKSGNRRL